MRGTAEAIPSFIFHELGLADRPYPAAFDAISRLTARLLDVPVSLVSIVERDRDRQSFIGLHGLQSPYSECRATPLSHSFCRHVQRSGEPLIVEDARQNPQFCENPAIHDLGVIAYLGVPISAPHLGHVGAICAISSEPRRWSVLDVDTLNDLALCVDDEILLRAALDSTAMLLARQKRHGAVRESIASAFAAPGLNVEKRFEALLQASCRALNMEFGWISKISAGQIAQLFSHHEAKPVAGPAAMPRNNVICEDALAHLRNQTLREQSIVQYSNLNQHNIAHCAVNKTKFPKRYISAPLVIDGVLYGTLDFASCQAGTRDFGEDDFSIMSIISMVTCSNLDTFDQIRMLRESERDLMQQVLELNGRDRKKTPFGAN